MNDREKYLALEKEFRLACIEIKQLKEDKLDRIESILSAELNLISRKYEILRDWYVNTWEDYDGLFGYSLGQTEHRVPVYDYPAYSFQTTVTMNNLEV